MRNFRNYWAIVRYIVIGALALVAAPLSLEAQSSSCNRARAIVEESRDLARTQNADHEGILRRLKTAMTLCPGEAEVWKLAYCSSLALGDQEQADRYRRRALLSGAQNVQCGFADRTVPSAAPRTPGFVRDKHALIVGIGAFQDSQIPRLQYTAKDARDLASVLVEHAYFPATNVTVLADAEATRANILEALQRLILEAHPDDLVLIYISSHGSPQRESQGLSGIGYIITYDTMLSQPWLDSIEYRDFSEKVTLIKADRLVTILDTCFAGQALAEGARRLVLEGGANVDVKTAEMFLSGDGDYVLTSSREDEQSWESDQLENGYFTHFLIEALRQPGGLAMREIFDYLAPRVTRAVSRDKGAGQHPQLRPDNGPGDLRIGVIPQSLQSSP